MYAYSPMAKKTEKLVLAAIVLWVMIRGGMVALLTISKPQGQSDRPSSPVFELKLQSDEECND